MLLAEIVAPGSKIYDNALLTPVDSSIKLLLQGSESREKNSNGINRRAVICSEGISFRFVSWTAMNGQNANNAEYSSLAAPGLGAAIQDGA